MNVTFRCVVAALLTSAAASVPALALEPAGGSPEAAAAQADGSESQQDASVQEAPGDPAVPSGGAPRSWLAGGGKEMVTPPPRESSGASTGLTLGAVLIVLGLGAAAIALRIKRQKVAPLSPSESRLTVLSSSRVGPKAYAVTAHVGGRVLLLGVTDHNVTNLGWLDAPEPEAARERADEESAAAPESDELPDDYPGSALRAPSAPVAFASTSDLKRFQEVLRGAVTARPELPMRPSYAGRAPDAATLLAAQTSDVVASGTAPALPAAPAAPISLRRKRRGTGSFPPREPREARPSTPSRAPQAPSSSLEGQVAGLRSIRER